MHREVVPIFKKSRRETVAMSNDPRQEIPATSTAQESSVAPEQQNKLSPTRTVQESIRVVGMTDDLEEIYNRVLRSILSPSSSHSFLKNDGSTPREKIQTNNVQYNVKQMGMKIYEDNDAATIILHVDSEKTAQKVAKRLNQKLLFQRMISAEVLPLEQLESHRTPLLIKVQCSAVVSVQTVFTTLSSLSGFLGVVKKSDSSSAKSFQEALHRQEDEASNVTAKQSKRSKRISVEVTEHRGKNDSELREEGDVTGTAFLATFVDEGSGLHARAILSGRVMRGAQEDQPVHMFLSRYKTNRAS